mmetsp:Transcript_9035/g.10215  ORF Transcript_9035/g.10215 Transcript_9035/m.10215 type:complete len:144 (+) Transcript_9035:19-450(+)|eukprot:CAMPEP_0205819404 /NCGR_PEP_ID=MMETSP0206-20130828/1766_1 /ASSEMBLY_ACC=CAM_ASM_000279 /TAXON_ID=36767 /ORGANISM="Euplotes focardii, Strain TN1" /LENGTH=143 /DNA_ID=CAMNT_0053112967 /DNA_START=19 /DNA_END=450 /DNA_ORIENTATION=+
MSKKGGNSKTGIGAALGIGALFGAAIVAGASYLLSNDKEEVKEELTSVEKVHVPPPLPMANNIPKDVEEKLLCPISLEIMTDPVVTPYGHTYERKNIEEYIERHGIDPMTRKPLAKDALIPNYSIRTMLEHYCETKDNNSSKK